MTSDKVCICIPFAGENTINLAVLIEQFNTLGMTVVFAGDCGVARFLYRQFWADIRILLLRSRRGNRGEFMVPLPPLLQTTLLARNLCSLMAHIITDIVNSYTRTPRAKLLVLCQLIYSTHLLAFESYSNHRIAHWTLNIYNLFSLKIELIKIRYEKGHSDKTMHKLVCFWK